MIIVDMEASGLNPQKHSVLSVGAIDFDHPEEQFYSECRVWDGAHIDDAALAVNGFTREEILDKSKEGEDILIRAYLDWIKNREVYTTGGQNPSIDRDFLRASAERAHIDWPMSYRTIDLHSVCYAHMLWHGVNPPVVHGRSDLNSDKILKYVGIPVEPHPHNALMGAKVAAEALSRLLNNKSLLVEFSTYKIPWIS